MDRLVVDNLSTTARELHLGDAKVFHLPNWHSLTHPQRLTVMRQIAMQRGRDPRIAKLAVSIIRKSGARPRQYEKQAAALLKWVQDPRNCYYLNEPGERLQDPLYTIRVKHGDCFAEDTLVLRDDMELVPIQNVRIGDKIWGRDRWSEVVNFWDKGKLPVTEICLNNGSVLRLTEGHKVYVVACAGPQKGERFEGGRPSRKDHGVCCRLSTSGAKQCEDKYGTKIVRIKVSELREGMEILQPDKIEQPTKTRWIDSEGAWLIGAFIAEGWAEEGRAMISGKDGHWKEATKERAKGYAETRGWNYRWHEKYIALNGKEAAAFVGECGKGALHKQIPLQALAEGNLEALDDGLKLDASQNTRGEGWTFGTISPRLATQYRVLQRMLGRSTSHKVVTNHGGYGNHPIHRVGVRNPKASADRRLLVRAIHRDAEEVPCYDIATDDHYVYLPEGDCTVSNCDDQVLLLTCLFEAVALPWRLVISGRHKTSGHKVRYIEGDKVPANVQWTHVYCMVGTPPFQPSRWYFCETTIEGVPLGWDIINGDHSYLPEMASKYAGPAQIVPAPKRGLGWFRPRLPPEKHRSPAYEEAYSDVYGASALGPFVGATAAASLDDAGDDNPLHRRVAEAVLIGTLTGIFTAVMLDVFNPLVPRIQTFLGIPVSEKKKSA